MDTFCSGVLAIIRFVVAVWATILIFSFLLGVFGA